MNMLNIGIIPLLAACSDMEVSSSMAREDAGAYYGDTGGYYSDGDYAPENESAGEDYDDGWGSEVESDFLSENRPAQPRRNPLNN